jgi:hypothetical protein
MKATLSRLITVMQQLFFKTPDEAAQQTGLIKRERQILPPPLALGLVFAWMQHPNATTDQLASSVTAAGSPSRWNCCSKGGSRWRR